MELDAVLRERRSMRKYQPDRKVSREQVEEILKAATLAPSWKNSQTARYYVCRLPRYLTKPRQRRSEWDMAGSDGISRVSAVFRGKSLLTNKMRII